MARGLASHGRRCCCRPSSPTTAAATATTAATCTPKILEHLGLARAELFYPGRAVYLLWVALLVSVVTALLPEGLHTVQQDSSGPTALLETEKREESMRHTPSAQTESSPDDGRLRQFRCPHKADWLEFHLLFFLIRVISENANMQRNGVKREAGVYRSIKRDSLGKNSNTVKTSLLDK